MFSGRLPENVQTDDNGVNKLYYAEAIQFDYIARPDDGQADDVSDWEDELEDAIEDFSDANSVIEAHLLYTGQSRKDLIQAL